MSKNTKHSRGRLPRSAIIYLLILIPTFVAVAIISFILINPPDPKDIVDAKINTLAKHYYEHSIYDKMLNADDYSGNPSDYLSKYHNPGLPRITIRQMILSGDAEQDADLDTLLKYCDRDKTSFIVYPDEPYSRDDYHVRIDHSCNF